MRAGILFEVQEHLAPLFPAFLSQFNPKDARFLGTPLDFIVFDGLDEGEVRRVVFVEVKTGRPASCLASADAVMRSRRDELSISCCACRQTYPKTGRQT